MTNREIVEYLDQRISEKVDKINLLSEELTAIEKEYAENKERLEIQIIKLRRDIHALKLTRNMELTDEGRNSVHENQSIELSHETKRILQLSESISKVRKTIVEVAYEILQGSDKPLSVQEITQLAKPVYKFHASRPEMSVTSALNRDARFESIGRGVWRIKESKKEESNEQQNI